MEQFTLRHDSFNGTHARVTLFANGAHCGNLTLRTEEWIAFCAALKMAADSPGAPIELTFDAAFDLHPPGHEPRVTLKQPPFDPPPLKLMNLPGYD